jgi:hypothetical protein
MKPAPPVVETHRPPAFACPVEGCGKKLDAATGGKEPPKPGDLTVCAYCINWLVFDPEMRPTLITEDEIISLDNEMFAQLSAYSRLMQELAEKKRRDS